MSILICDYCGDYIEENEVFYEKIECLYIDENEVSPQQVMQRLCEKCEVLLR